MAKSVDLLMKDVAKSVTITVNVKDYKSWMIRLKIATLFIRLGCWIANVNYEEE